LDFDDISKHPHRFVNPSIQDLGGEWVHFSSDGFPHKKKRDPSSIDIYEKIIYVDVK
jgi:hypothetical protein